MKVSVREIDKKLKIYSLYDEDKKKECYQFDLDKSGLEKEFRRQLLFDLRRLALLYKTEGKEAFQELVKENKVCKIIKNKQAEELNVWEIRDDAHPGRLMFLALHEDGFVILSAANKGSAAKGKTATELQNEAIQKGIKRWKQFLKN